MASNIHLEHRPDGAAVIWLARPERNNAFDEALIRELSDVLDDIDKDPNVNAVVLAGEGESFCAGADLAWMRRAATYDRAENLADATNVAALLYRLDQLSKPTIARVQGAVYGDGVGLLPAATLP